MDISRRQAFVKVQQNFDRVEARVDRRCERFPVGFSLANKLRLRRVAHNQSIKSRDRETAVSKVKEKKEKNRGVSAAGQGESLLPFTALNELRPALPPTVGQEIKFDRRRGRLDPYELGGSRENPLHHVAQIVTTFIEQDAWKGTIDALQLCA